MMRIAGRVQIGLMVVLLGIAAGADAQTQPSATRPAATAPATTRGGRKPTVDEILTKETAAFELVEKPITAALAQLSKSYGVTVINDVQDAKELDNLMTVRPPRPLTARQAISILNDTLIALGYTLLESVKGEPPVVILTVVPIKKDQSAVIAVFYENDPDKIPQGEELRTQVIKLTNLDPAKVKETVASVLGKRANVTVNASTKTVIITDTSSNVRMAATLIKVLEKQAAEGK